jgi:hypothetical protein
VIYPIAEWERLYPEHLRIEQAETHGVRKKFDGSVGDCDFRTGQIACPHCRRVACSSLIMKATRPATTKERVRRAIAGPCAKNVRFARWLEPGRRAWACDTAQDQRHSSAAGERPHFFGIHRNKGRRPPVTAARPSGISRQTTSVTSACQPRVKTHGSDSRRIRLNVSISS